PPTSSLFPYTTLFRSQRDLHAPAGDRLALVRSARLLSSPSRLRTMTSPTTVYLLLRRLTMAPASTTPAARPMGKSTREAFGLARSEEHTSELQSRSDL